MAAPDLRAALERLAKELNQKQADEVPEGWMTVDQWSQGSGMSLAAVKRRLAAAHKRGLIEMQEFRIVAGLAGIRRVAHYRVKTP